MHGHIGKQLKGWKRCLNIKDTRSAIYSADQREGYEDYGHSLSLPDPGKRNLIEESSIWQAKV